MFTSLSKSFFVFFILCMAFNLYAKRFANEYTEFELPPGWECMLEGSEWVCQSANKQRQKEAIIILVAKVRGQQDTLDQYLGYLKNAKSYGLPGGRRQVSEPVYAKTKKVNDHSWIDALHLASEVPGFYTRYLATTKEDLGVAVTFSVSKDHYSDYQGVFDKVVGTLRVFRQKQIQLSKYVRPKDGDIFNPGDLTEDGVGVAVMDDGQKKQTTGGGGDEGLLLLVGIALVVGFIILKKRKKNKK